MYSTYNGNVLQTYDKTYEEYKGIPLLRQVPVEKHPQLFREKLQLCSITFNFEQQNENMPGKELKRTTLLELVDYVNVDEGQKIFRVEGIMKDTIQMISANIFRPLSPPPISFDEEEDEPVFEPAWPHLQVVYEFLLRFVVSREVTAKVAKKECGFDQRFCARIVKLFDSDDPRERDYLKTILHRIYGKFMSHRGFIRKYISYTFQKFANQTQHHNGIPELLEILGSIINGFALPLKAEHQTFLITTLIPLHKPKTVAVYHQQLSYCIVQYIEKDINTALPILNGILKLWPWASSSKQMLFLNELESILEHILPTQFQQIESTLLRVLSRCMSGDHFQVMERTLFFWNNELLVSNFLVNNRQDIVLPLIFNALDTHAQNHWNPTVRSIAQAICTMYKSNNIAEWKRIKDECERKVIDRTKRLMKREVIWSEIKQSAV